MRAPLTVLARAGEPISLNKLTNQLALCPL
jgi:hypothetical protein